MKKIVLLCALLLAAATLEGAEVKRYPVPLDNSPAHGGKNATVTIVEFIDYQ